MLLCKLNAVSCWEGCRQRCRGKTYLLFLCGGTPRNAECVTTIVQIIVVRCEMEKGAYVFVNKSKTGSGIYMWARLIGRYFSSQNTQRRTERDKIKCPMKHIYMKTINKHMRFFFTYQYIFLGKIFTTHNFFNLSSR